MKLKKIMAAMVACMVMWASLGVANATTKADTVTPLYLYARTVSANLQISSSGYATCFGRIVTKGTENDISITVTLYRQSGKDWIRVDGWGNLKTGTNILNLQKSRSVEKGTYMVVVTGWVTPKEGEPESVRDTSDIITYQ